MLQHGLIMTEKMFLSLLADVGIQHEIGGRMSRGGLLVLIGEGRRS